MAEKATSGAAGRAPAAGQPENVRNVVLVGHSGAGKTTLAEALLAATSTIQRLGRVEDGSTVSDFDEVEIRQQRSVNLTPLPLVHNDVKVNLLDTPGYADFMGDLRAGLRAADAALFAISAADGIDGLTSILWDECASAGTPRAVVITKLDHHRGDFNEALDACRAAFGESVAPLYLPVGDGQGTVNGLIGLLSERYYEYSDGKRTERDPDPADTDRMEEYRGALIESIIQESEDESLMDRYLSGEEIDQKILIDDLEKAVARGSFYPVIPAAAQHRLLRRGRHLRGGQADQRGDRRHAVGQGAAAADGVVGDARAAAADRDLGQVEGRRGQDVPGAVQAGRRGLHAAAGEQRGDPPARALVHGRGPRRPAARPALQPVRRGRRDGRAAGSAAGDGRREVERPRPEREAVRRSRRVRHLPHRGRAAAVGRRVRVRRQDRRRRGSAAVHPVRGEGRADPDGAGRGRRLPDGRPQGHALRRQGALGRLVRHGVPEGRPRGAARRDGEGAAPAARAGRRGLGADRRRLRRRGHVRPVLPARPGARHRAGGRRPDAGQGRDPRARADQVRDRPPFVVARHRLVLPLVPEVRTAPLAPQRKSDHRGRSKLDPARLIELVAQWPPVHAFSKDQG